jgi:hypothetical protein
MFGKGDSALRKHFGSALPRERRLDPGNNLFKRIRRYLHKVLISETSTPQAVLLEGIDYTKLMGHFRPSTTR